MAAAGRDVLRVDSGKVKSGKELCAPQYEGIRTREGQIKKAVRDAVALSKPVTIDKTDNNIISPVKHELVRARSGLRSVVNKPDRFIPG